MRYPAAIRRSPKSQLLGKNVVISMSLTNFTLKLSYLNLNSKDYYFNNQSSTNEVRWKRVLPTAFHILFDSL